MPRSWPRPFVTNTRGSHASHLHCTHIVGKGYRKMREGEEEVEREQKLERRERPNKIRRAWGKCPRPGRVTSHHSIAHQPPTPKPVHVSNGLGTGAGLL